MANDPLIAKILDEIRSEESRCRGDGFEATDGNLSDAIARVLPASIPVTTVERVRVLRLLEYVGTREQIEEQLTTGAFPGGVGVRTFPRRDGSGLTITSTLVTPWPELLEASRVAVEQDYCAEISKLRIENDRIRRAMTAFGDDAVKILSEIK